MPNNRKFSAKGIKQGRSIEEIIMLRKLEATNPNSWPTIESNNKQTISQQIPVRDKLMSSSLPSADPNTAVSRLMYSVNSNMQAARTFDALTWSESNIDKSEVYRDGKDETIKSLVEYCKTLQSRIKVR